ncbi:hypothetical protein Mterra_00560 [Calidithermus terrae]|uniref:Cytochrome c domain-containing protein n=1 Tax=Calidithermus terrae TaxID=1408545 RepID=A0A399F284_9DEIN|nr:hypothetical protein [Calidithermus terrae]RIH90328.1 hypothetical protein Mterra_00560 [Calidithermus terrae]
MKKILTWVLLGSATVLLSLALARPPYRTQAVQQFHLSPGVTCQFCHVNANGGAPWNPFGELVRANFKGTINAALYEALKAMKDSDGDGYLDALEVFAGTLPGSPDSKPLVDAAFLKANFDKAGGVDLYKPAQ